MSNRDQYPADDRFVRTLLLFTFCGVLLLVIAIVAVSFFSANTPGDETVMHWRPPLMAAETADGRLVERLTQRWIAYVALVALLVSIISALTLILTLAYQVRSSNAAVATFHHNRRMGEMQTRAYVHTDNFYAHDLGPGLFPYVSFSIRNFGQSPAFDVVHKAELKIVQADDFDYFKFGDNSFPRSLDMLPPGDSLAIEIFYPNEMILAEWIHFNEGDAKLVIFGFLSYRDIFRRRHLCTFSQQLDIGGWNPEGPSKMHMSEEHNRSS